MIFDSVTIIELFNLYIGNSDMLHSQAVCVSI